MKKIFLTIIFLSLFQSYGAHLYKESYYQKLWCDKWQGIMEYRLDDDTRVDCLTKTYAVEFDFAPKWAESIGQSLYYANETDKNPAIVLILEKKSDLKYFKRAQKIAQKFNIALWYMKMPEKYQQDVSSKSLENQLYSLISNLLKGFINDILKFIFA